MPRNSSGTYTLPSAAFVPGGLIKSADENANFSDIATALTQSLATTGVSTMTGPIKAAPGSVSAPSYTFNGSTASGFYLVAANQIGWSANGVSGATFNSDTSVSWAGAQTYAASATFNAAMVFNFTTFTFTASARAAFHNSLGDTISIQIIIDNGGNVITTGVRGYIEVPCDCTVNRTTVMAAQSGSIVVDIWRANGALPTSAAQSIAGSAKPTLSTAQFSTNTTLTGWTTTLAAQDVIAFNVDSVTSIQRVTVALTALRT